MIISAVIVYGGDFDKNLFEKSKKSVGWCDELILINGADGSFKDWRNEGFRKAKGEWILYVDSDEEVSYELKSEIEKDISNPKFSAYAIPRKNYIFGKAFKYGGEWPDFQKRLFLRSSFRGWTGKLHEEPNFEGELHHMNNSLTHYKNITLKEMVEKTNKWSEIEARLMFDAHHPPMTIFRFFSAGFREFWQRMIVHTAFLDGTEGIIYALYQVFSRLISYSKLWELQLKN